MNLQLTQQEKSIIQSIVNIAGIEAFAFGSRARGTARQDSDLDLCLKSHGTSVPLSQMTMFREKFENSRLPFVVDIVDFSNLPLAFQQKIQQEWVQLV